MNVDLFNLIHDLSGKSWLLDWAGVLFAQYVAYLIVVYILYLIFFSKKIKNRFYFFSYLTLSAILSRGILTPIIRFFIPIERPFLTLNFTPLIDRDLASSLPSGHAAFFFALAFAVWYFARREGYCLIAVSLLMGLARIFVGMHWPLDILAGILIAAFSVLMVSFILKPKHFDKIPVGGINETVA